MSDIEINEQGVINVLLNIDIKKSPGHDNIPNEFLYRYAEWFASHLTVIYHFSVATCCFPFDWKTEKIVPIYKSGNKLDVSNYRPIFLISKCLKSFEHMVSKQLSLYLDNFHILDHCRHGFRKQHSTVTQLNELTHDLASALNDRKQVDIIFLDFAKAFDQVSYSKLLLKSF